MRKSFNEDLFRDHFDNDDELMKSVINEFVVHYPKLKEEIHTSVKTQRKEEIVRGVHTLKGVLMNFFAESLVSHLERLEQEAPHLQEEQLVSELDEIYKSIELLTLELKEIGG